jgi:hypothetical protein
MATPSWAQTSQGDSVSVGYQYAHASSGGEGTSFGVGFGFDYGHGISGPWSVIGALDWSRDSESVGGVDLNNTLTSYGAGARWGLHGGDSGLTLFAQAVLGAARTSASSRFGDVSETSFMVRPGAGALFMLTFDLGLLVEADYQRVFTEHAGANVVRVFIAGRYYFK